MGNLLLPLFHIFKINILTRFVFGGRLSGLGGGCLLASLLFHAAVHFLKTFFDLAGGGINGYHQLEDKLVQQVS